MEKICICGCGGKLKLPKSKVNKLKYLSKRKYILGHFKEAHKGCFKENPAKRAYHARARNMIDTSQCTINNKICNGCIDVAHIDQDHTNNKVQNLEAQLFLLNSSNMGVPQRRERVFFIARRKDLKLPKIALDFNEKPVFFGDIRTDKGLQRAINPETKMYKLWSHRKKADANFSTIANRILGSSSFFSETILHDDKVPPTLVSGSSYYLFDKPFDVSSNDLISIQSFPQDYDFVKNSYGFIKYVLGMSVPPLMTAGVAKEVAKQLLQLSK